jgi:protein O-GlcNAc transferase
MAHVGLTFETGPRPTAEGDKKDIRLTFLKRKGSRKLLQDEALLDAIRSNYPRVEVKSVDMGSLSLPEQLRTIQETDLLLGVHGAGLTHMMFMREGAGAVVEIQPEGLSHKGFRNLAAMTGQKYFVAQAEIVSAEEEEEREKEREREREKQEEPPKGGNRERAARRGEKNWQSSAVRIDEERFLALVDAALKSLYNEGLRSHDVV